MSSKFDTCLSKKAVKNVELLGQSSSPEEKRSRAFTVQSYQGYWDIGKPKLDVTTKSINDCRLVSKLDHSVTYDEPRLIWEFPIVELDLANDMIVEFIEGLADWNPVINKVAMSALTDIYRHSAPETLVEIIPYMTEEMNRLLRKNFASSSATAKRFLENIHRMLKLQKTLAAAFIHHGKNTMRLFQRYNEPMLCPNLLASIGTSNRALMVKVVNQLIEAVPQELENIYNCLRVTS